MPGRLLMDLQHSSSLMELSLIALFFTDVIYNIVYFRPEVSSHSLDVSLKFVLHIKIALLVTSIDVIMMNYNFKNIVTKFSADIRFKCSKNFLKIISISWFTLSQYIDSEAG